MSRHGEVCCNNMGLGGVFSNNILNLIIFVLIVLQFGKKCEREDPEGCHDEDEIDNSILFIIALFFLFVCGCGSGLGLGARC